MIKKSINNNIKKISIIGIALAFIIGLILLISNLIPRTGTLQSQLSDTISSFAVNVKDSQIGQTIYRQYYRDLCYNPNVYCIKKGKGFPNGNIPYTVNCKYSLSGTKISAVSKNENYTVNGEGDYKYHVAVLYVMSKQKNNQYECNSCQWAMWAIMSYFGSRNDNSHGYTTSCTINTLSGEAREIAEGALAYADYMWQQHESITPKTTTNMNNITYTDKKIGGTEYVIAGPYSVQYPSVSRRVNEETYTFGKIDISKNSTVEVCDKNGNKKDASYIASNKSSFYLRVKKSDLNSSKQTFSISYTKTILSGTYYHLKCQYGGDQDLVEGSATLKTANQSIVLEIPGPTRKEVYESTDFNLELAKKDDKYNETLKNSIFDYVANDGKWEQIENKEGIISIPTIVIDANTYRSLATGENGKKVYTILVEERQAPEGYEKSTGNIELALALSTKDSSKTENNVTTITHEIKIDSVTITNNSSNQIQVGNTKVDTGESEEINVKNGLTVEDKEDDKGNKYKEAYISIDITNPKIEYPDYQITLDKLGVNNSSLIGAKFKVEIGAEDAVSDKAKDQIEVTTKNGEEITYTKGFSGANNEKATVEVTPEDGKFIINLKDIKYEGVLNIKIKEIDSPENYGIISDTIEIKLTIDSNKQISEVSSNIESLTNVSVISQQDKQNIYIQAIDNKALCGEDEIRIVKYGNDDKLLPGVTFTVYDGDDERKQVGKITTSNDGITDSFKINYQADYTEDKTQYNVGEIVTTQKYIIKETTAKEGYKGLSDNEKVYLEMYGMALSSQNNGIADTIKTAYSILKNDTDKDITLKVYDKVNNTEGIVTIKSEESIILYNSEYKTDIEDVKQEYNIEVAYDTILSDNNNIIINIVNDKIEESFYKFRILKVDSLTNKVLKGAIFALYDTENFAPGVSERETIGEPVVTGEDGFAEFTIPLVNSGTFSYYLQETKAPEGCVKFGEDEYIRLDLEIIFNDAANKYEVSSVKVYNRLSQNEYTGNRSIFINNVEVKAPGSDTEEYNSNDDVRYTHTVQGNELNDITIKLQNDTQAEEGKFSIDVEKINSKGNNKIGGAVFSLQNTNKQDQREWTLTTNESGEDSTGDINITQADWSAGTKTYILQETKAPQGYEKLEGQVNIEVKFIRKQIDGKYTYAVKEVEVTNRTNGKIIVNKNKELEVEVDASAICEINRPNITITVPNEPKIDLALKKFITGVTDNQGNYTATTGREPTYNTESLKTTTEATYTFDKTKPVEVSKGNIVRYTIRIYNEGQSDGYASEIKDYLPNGVKLAENSSVNSTYGWTIGEDANGQYITTTYLKDQKIGKYEGGITLNYKDVEVELEVTMTDMYLGTLKNVAEIAEMKDQDGNLISDDVDSSTEKTTITRGGDTITDYNPKEDDIDYDWIKLKDGIPFAGKVWLDVPEENTKDTENSLLDSHEGFDKIKENGGVIAEIYQVKNGQMILIATTPVNGDGIYEFKDIKKSDDGVNYNNYVIQFKYHGINYTNVEYKVGTDYKINSKAQEDALERTAFNNKFATINNQSEITYTTTSDDGSKKLTSKYNYTDNMKMTAKTETISLNINTNTDELLYFNLGLKQRPTFDMALYKDVDHATVTVNGQEQIYTYDKYSSYNPESGTFDEFAYTVRNSDYNLGIRSVDRTEDAGLSIYVTYKINLINQSNTYGYVSKLVDYYDSHYTYASAQVKNNAGEIVDVGLTVTPHEESTISSSDANYYKMDINVGKNTNTILDNNENLYIYITLQFKDPASSLQTLSDGNNLRTMNFAEIAEYQTFNSKDGNVTPGLIDIDSAPGNFNVATYKKGDYTEDDIDQAPALTYVDNGSMRTITGNVFEEIDNADDINIKDVKVELIEIDGSGNPIMENGSYRSLTYKVTSTDENGNYIFENYLPGNYMIRFSYGDSKQIVLTTANGGSNDTSYNGQDYASTDYIEENYADLYWYTSVTDKSDATDDGDRRNAVNEYSQDYTNYIAEVLNSWKENPIDEDKVAELIEKTHMFADTANMTLSVEYGSTKFDSNSIPEYKVEGIDFGLKKRPTIDIVIKKEVSKVTVTSSSGETLVSSDMTQGPEGKSNNVLWVKDSLVKVELEDALINGANLQIEYKVTLKNESEEGAAPTKVTGIIDYVDNNLRFEEENNTGWEVVTDKELQKDNEEESLVNNDIDLSKRQVILKASTDNPLLDKELEVGETLEEFATLTLTKTITTSNSAEDDLSYDNIIEIVETWNAQGRKTGGTPGDLLPDPDPDNPPHDPEPGEDTSETVTISNPTGQTQIYYVLGITIGVILIIGIVCIKKFVLRKKD